MAVYKGARLTGSIGPVISYWVNGKNYIRSRNNDIRQTKAMKQNAASFGRIKNISSGLRLGLKAIYDDYKSKPAMFAVDTAVRSWFNRVYPTLKQASMNSPYFESIPINQDAPSKTEIVLGVKPLMVWSISGKVVIHIPELEASNMYLPANARGVAFTLVVSGARASKTDSAFYGASEAIETMIVNGKVTAMNVEVNIDIPDDYLFLAYLQVSYLTQYGWLKEKRWKPIIVVGSCYKV